MKGGGVLWGCKVESGVCVPDLTCSQVCVLGYPFPDEEPAPALFSLQQPRAEGDRRDEVD